MGQLEAFLGIALELSDIDTGLGLALLQTFQQRLQFGNGVLGLGLRFGFAGDGRVLQFGPCFVQQNLTLTALLLQLGEHFFSINQRSAASVFQMFKQAVRELLQQVQRGRYRVLLGGHGLPPGV